MYQIQLRHKSFISRPNVVRSHGEKMGDLKDKHPINMEKELQYVVQVSSMQVHTHIWKELINFQRYKYASTKLPIVNLYDFFNHSSIFKIYNGTEMEQLKGKFQEGLIVYQDIGEIVLHCNSPQKVQQLLSYNIWKEKGQYKTVSEIKLNGAKQ